MTIDFDLILPDVGEYGNYQKLMVWFVFLPGMIPCGFHAYNQLFMATQPKFRCLIPDLDLADRNFTEEFIRNASIPFVRNKDGRWNFSSCSMYSRNYSVEEDLTVLLQASGNLSSSDIPTVPCQAGWKFQNNDQETTTVVTEWELVCDKDFYPTMALVLFGISGLIGNWIFGYIQDSMGRRPAFFIYLLIESIFAIATAFAPTFGIWLACRIGVGFTVPAIMGTPFVMAIELVGPSWRTHVALLANVVYSCTLCLLGVVVWLVRDWRQMSLATSLPFLAFFFYWWVLPESPRWLLSQNRLAEAEVEIRKMARINKRSLPAGYFNQFKTNVEESGDDMDSSRSQPTYGALDLVKTPNMARKTAIVTFIWFTVTSVYVGLSYYAPALGGNEYLNFLLAGVAELPTYFFLWPTMDRWGRRWTLCFSMILGGVACLATLSFQDDYVVMLVLYCIGKFGISSAFVVLPLMASELYPTVVRGIGISISGVAGMLGPIFIPLINYLGTESLMVLPLMIMGGLMVAGGLCALTLPETLHQHLPQTLEEGELFGKDFGYKQWLTCCPPRPNRREHGKDVAQRLAENSDVAKPLVSLTIPSSVTSAI
ncbi:beta-alanine transporter [Daphnia magna]|uniref:beta-alanine transporter n=1 Tax=Daphnia magna TaxID=35525 RepID=UPI001E1BBDE4|nr:beta-alanine transporter [Daphnia magna]